MYGGAWFELYTHRAKRLKPFEIVGEPSPIAVAARGEVVLCRKSSQCWLRFFVSFYF